MIHPAQQSFQYAPNPRCPFCDYLDPGDNHCWSHFDGNNGYQVFCENNPIYASWLADIGGVDFGDIVPLPTPDLYLPPYIPTIPKAGGKRIISEGCPPFVSVSLGDVVSKKHHFLPVSLRERFGIPPEVKILLQAYGKDALIESIWPKREDFYIAIGKLGFDLITGINYSVWHEQPHAERLINVKRSLVTFSEMQRHGLPAIPHMYWSGRRDLERWAEWLNNNPQVGIVATDLQTERTHKVWDTSVEELSLYFVPLLKREIHFLVTGASTIDRVAEVRNLFSNAVTISNKYLAMMSIFNQELFFDRGVERKTYLPNAQPYLFSTNLERYLFASGITQLTSLRGKAL